MDCPVTALWLAKDNAEISPILKGALTGQVAVACLAVCGCAMTTLTCHAAGATTAVCNMYLAGATRLVGGAEEVPCRRLC